MEHCNLNGRAYLHRSQRRAGIRRGCADRGDKGRHDHREGYERPDDRVAVIAHSVGQQYTSHRRADEGSNLQGETATPGGGRMMAAVEELRADAHIVLKEEKQGLVRLSLNAPQKRNALSEEMLSRLQDEIDAAGESDDVGCVIIAARGPVFSSGHDLKQLKSHRQDRDGGRSYFASI